MRTEVLLHGANPGSAEWWVEDVVHNQGPNAVRLRNTAGIYTWWIDIPSGKAPWVSKRVRFENINPQVSATMVLVEDAVLAAPVSGTYEYVGHSACCSMGAQADVHHVFDGGNVRLRRPGTTYDWVFIEPVGIEASSLVGKRIRIVKGDDVNPRGSFEIIGDTSGVADAPTLKEHLAPSPSVHIATPPNSGHAGGATMTGIVYQGTVVRTRSVAAGEGLTTAVSKSEIVHSSEKFVALDGAKATAIVLIDAIEAKKLTKADLMDTGQQIEVKFNTPNA